MLKATRNDLINEKKIKEGMMKYNRRKNFKSSQGHGKAKINQKKGWKNQKMDKRESPACLECSSLIKKVWKPKKMRKYHSGYEKNKYDDDIQVNICQKHLFLHQLTHNMMTDCSLNYEFST